MSEQDPYRKQMDVGAQRNPYVDPNKFIIFNPRKHDTISCYAGPCAISVVFEDPFKNPERFGIVHLKEAWMGECLFHDFWREWQACGFAIRDAITATMMLGGTGCDGIAEEFGEENLQVSRLDIKRRGVLRIPVAIRGHKKSRLVKVDPSLESPLSFREGDFLEKDASKKKDLPEWQTVDMKKLIAKKRAATQKVFAVPKGYPTVRTSPVSPRDAIPASVRGLPLTQSKAGIWHSA